MQLLSVTVAEALQLLLSKELKKLRITDYELRMIERHFFPTPRVELGKKLIEKNLSKCAIDVSDGLLADLNHICQASKLQAEIDLEKIPFSQKNPKNPLDLLSGGDDYELVFAVNPKNQKKISALACEIKLDLTCIGKFTDSARPQVLLRQNNKKIKLTKLGYEH